MNLKPLTQRAAFAFVQDVHRHHKPPRGAVFQIGLEREEELVGVVVVGRPVSRMLQDGYTAEVTRLCTDGSRNACSMLYGAAARAAKALGYKKIITYILSSEPGISLKASGWECEGEAGGGSWSRSSRGREDKHPVEIKTRWSKRLVVEKTRRKRMTACFVESCDYVAEGAIEDFQVCALHNCWQTHKILKRMKLPMSCYSDNRPVVMPSRDLRAEDFEPKPSRKGIRAVDDPALAEVPDTPSRKIFPDYDLTRP